MNSANTLLNILCELAFADLVQPLVIRKGSGLMEFTEKFIHLERGVVENKLVPESTLLNGADTLIITNDLLEIPGEGKDISMLLLIESHVNTELLISLIKINSILLLLLDFNFGSVESARNIMALKSSCYIKKWHHSAL